MKINMIGRKITIKESTKEYIEKKLSKLDKFFNAEPEARVVVGTVKDMEYVEATVYAAGMIFRAEITDVDATTAIDRIEDIIERQIRKNKTRLAKKLKSEYTVDIEPSSNEKSNEFDIIKTKRFAIKPMNPEEAVLQMNLLGHDFFVFKNDETNEMNVVYKRKDGKYAVIEASDYK